MKKHKTLFLILLLILALILIFSSKNNKDDSQPIKIGALLILSGDFASWGHAAQNAIDLAVSEVNKNGGIRGKNIEIIYEDTQGDPNLALTAYTKLTEIDQVTAIIGPLWQVEVIALAPHAARDRVPIITPATAPLPDRVDPRNPLLIWLDPEEEARRVAEYVFNEGTRRVAIFGTYDSWETQVSQAFKIHFEKFGGEISAYEIFAQEERDIRTILTKSLDTHPDALFIGTYYQFLPLTKAIKESGYIGNLYGIEIDDYLAGESNGIANDLQFIATDSFKSDFLQKYEAQYKEKASIPAGQSYDAMKILISFLKKDHSPEGILRQMQKFESYEGVSGNIRITEDHRTLIPTAIYELQNGEIVKLQTYP